MTHPDRDNKPEWAPPNAGNEFASFVMRGVNTPSPAGGLPGKKRRSLTVDEHVDGVLSGNRMILARTITLIESNAPAHRDMGQEVLQRLMPHAGRSMRVGISGVPGAGKSTFIEALGSMLCEQGHRVAVLAVDPSSTLSGGSILGDKTRMERLSAHPNAYIRPSPTGGNLGGVTEKSRSTIQVCEAAGYDVIIVETVGVGQNEIAVRGMVDCYMLLGIAGAGDDLQGIKKGVIEIADLFVVNKADGDNKARARRTQAEMSTVLHYLTPYTPEWSVQALTCSALKGDGVADVWESVTRFFAHLKEHGWLEQRRAQQNVGWLHELMNQELRHLFLENPAVAKELPHLEKEVAAGKTPVYQAAKSLLSCFQNKSR